MSIEDGTQNFGPTLVGGVRRDQPTAGGPVVWPVPQTGTMDGFAQGQGGAGNPALQAAPSVRPTPAAATVTEVSMKSGVNCKLTRLEVEAAIKLRVHELRSARGLQVPANVLDFLQRAAVHWTGDGEAMITWEE